MSLLLIPYSLVVEPVVTLQTPWFESIGAWVCNNTKLVGVLFGKEPKVLLLVVWAKFIFRGA